MFWPVVSSAICGAFGLIALMNVGASFLNRRQALAAAGPAQEQEMKRFVRFWIALNALAGLSFLTAAVLLWWSWPLAFALALWPLAWLAVGSMKRRLPVRR